MEGTNKSYAYPIQISEIPYASFIKINKYSYKDGLKQVAQNQRDALGSVSNSSGIRNVTNAISNTANWAYNSGTKSDKYARIAADNDDFGDVYFRNAGDVAAIKQARKENGVGWFTKDERTNDDILDMKFEGRYIGGEREQVSLREVLDRKDAVRKFNDEGYAKSYCNLALPNEFQYQYGANWNNTFKLGTMALLADDPKRAAIILGGGGALGAGGGLLKNRARGGNNLFGDLAAGTAKGSKYASNPFSINSDLMDPTNIAGLAGMAPNENAIQFFSKMEFRQFELNFEFASRNEKESTMIQDILKWFKIGMHPASLDPLGSGTGVLLGFPDVFVLEPRFVPVKQGVTMSSEPHKMMPKTKLCALQGLNVNTTPFGTVSTVHDGTIPLITATLRFTELTALTRTDFDSDKHL